MASLADIPEDLLDPEHSDLFIMWLGTLPITEADARAFCRIWTGATGRTLNQSQLELLSAHMRRRNG